MDDDVVGHDAVGQEDEAADSQIIDAIRGRAADAAIDVERRRGATGTIDGEDRGVAGPGAVGIGRLNGDDGNQIARGILRERGGGHRQRQTKCGEEPWCPQERMNLFHRIEALVFGVSMADLAE